MKSKLIDNITQYHWFLWLFLIVLSSFFLFNYGNHEFSLLVNQNHNEVLDFFFKYVTYLGDGAFVFVMAFIFLFIKKEVGISALISLLITTIFVTILKRGIYSTEFRPCYHFKSLIDNGTWNLVEGIELHIKYSFPSGHTASAFCILISMCFLLSNNFYSFLMVGVAFIIGFSRIYLSQHFLIDVIIGAIIGSLIPLFTHIYLQPIISRKILKRKIE